MSSKLISDIITYLKEVQTVSFATCVENIPYVRPMTMIWFEENLWFVTGTNAVKSQQLRDNPKLEVCLPLANENNQGYIRLNGDVKFSNDLEEKRKIFKSIEFIKHYFESPESEEFFLIKFTPVNCELLVPGDMDGQKGAWE